MVMGWWDGAGDRVVGVGMEVGWWEWRWRWRWWMEGGGDGRGW